MSRVTWETYFLDLADAASKRATCPTLSVGAVLVDPFSNNVISMGYNGAPRGTQHCGDACAKRKPGENKEVCRALHGEDNAILNAAYNGVSTRGGYMYLTHSPCQHCSRKMINAGIQRVTFRRYYGEKKFQPGIKELESAGLVVDPYGEAVSMASQGSDFDVYGEVPWLETM
jgi:dCMP deaminase